MILGLTTFTLIHVVVSLVGIIAGLVVAGGLVGGKRLDRWAVVFLVTTIATSATGHRLTSGVGPMRLAHATCVILACAVALPAHAVPPVAPNRVTILYDAFGDRAGLTRDWGFAALVEYNGKRILFDTGNNGDVFANNVRALGVDLRTIDFVVISHRHGDHTAGLNYLLTVNPGVKIYAPKEGFGVFGAELPGMFYRSDSTLPGRMRYFDGRRPAELTFGTPWPTAHFVWVDSVTEVAPGVSVIPTVSQKTGTLELRELSLALRTPSGLILLVGCSHPGIETIVE